MGEGRKDLQPAFHEIQDRQQSAGVARGIFEVIDIIDPAEPFYGVEAQIGTLKIGVGVDDHGKGHGRGNSAEVVNDALI